MKKVVLMAVALLSFAMVSAQSAGEIVQKYNDGAAALQAKDWAKALSLFESVVKGGADSEDSNVVNCVATAKKYIPTCYQRIGTAAAGRKDYAAAIENLTKAADKAELWGDMQGKAKANTILAKVYQVQGGEAFNAEDYITAVAVFEKGYAANPRNTDMALNLAESYFKLGEYQKGMDVCNNICGMNATKYAEAIASAREKMSMYTNNEVARLQQAGDHDGIIAMAEAMLATDPTSALAEKIRIQAYNNKKDYDKVIELGETAALAQTTEDDKSDVYFILGAAYNAKEMKPQAIVNLEKVVAGNSVEPAKAALAELKK
ncbi:MAG: tetratricopeptide repeat protein [Alistipes sp.]|jgi:tetratricopeptide (TPR) repeat protein|nr:tetratricopeptide repeat protein [Alistipes sp.]